jgi:anti-sigma factor RsiW
VNCAQAQKNLSLYLYGELSFAEEEAFELHLEGCALCASALVREKAWHSTVNAEQKDVPLELLTACRQELSEALSTKRSRKSLWGWLRWPETFPFSFPVWSRGIAVMSFLLFIGFTAGRWAERSGFVGRFAGDRTDEMGLFDSSVARIRDIQPTGDHRVRIVVDQTRQREIIGSIEEASVRRLLLQAVQDAADPGIRVDSIEMLTGESSEDVLSALAHTAENDPNAAVRLKAVQALQPLVNDPRARVALVSVLEHDENPDVRTAAIDALAPASADLGFDPQVADTLEQIVNSPEAGDYLRLRCFQILGEMQSALDVH